ncbi:MAG: sigma-70 family RNA polymerase sigma factor [Clostridia bacterium]|nr:sigma-70 family RNA polymerase sigma factor [Clostridia bacterium]
MRLAEDFDAVYKEHYQLVYRFALRLCGQASLAEEIAQETFYQALRSYGRFRGDSSLATWLCGIAKRVYWETVKKPRDLPLDDEAQHPQAPDIVESLVAGDRRMTAQRVLHSLDEPYREVFTLRTFCDLSHAEIGSLFGKTENWSRVTYYRARQLLQRAMKEADEHEE